MASAEEIKARIGSIRQTKKVTDAMYMISSVKMRRAKREVISTEPYFNALKEQISDLFLYIPENFYDNHAQFWHVHSQNGTHPQALHPSDALGAPY